MIPNTPIPPYFAVIFSSKRNGEDSDNYDNMAKKMIHLAQKQKGFLGYESFRDEGGYGVTISYWEKEECISEWKRNLEHREAQKMGKKKWYDEYKLRIAKIERDYGFER